MSVEMSNNLKGIFLAFAFWLVGCDQLIGGGGGLPPSAPKDLLVTPSNDKLTIVWQPNPSNENVTTYVVYMADVPFTNWSSALPGAKEFHDLACCNHTISGLNNTTPHHFEIVAVNKFGKGPPTGGDRLLTAMVAGSGIITSSPTGINCPGDCTVQYTLGTPVILSATPATGFVLTGWVVSDGEICAPTKTCTVTVNVAKTVTATFAPTFAMTITDLQNGTVTSSPTGITCGSDCTEPYLSETLIVLTATPNAGYALTGWSGTATGCIGTVSPVTVTMGTAPVTCTPTFAFIPIPATLSVGNNSIGEDFTTTTVTVSLSTPATLPVTVTLIPSFPSTASNMDYTLPTTITILPGQSSGSVTLTVVNDTSVEGTEMVTITVNCGTGSNCVVLTPISQTVTITDNDVPTMSLSAFSPTTISEGPTGTTTTITATLSVAAIATTTITLAQTAGTATTTDYTLPTTITILPGQSSGSVTLTVVNDTLVEGNETVTITATCTVNCTSASTPKTVTITDNDVPTVTLSVGAPSINETTGATSTLVTVTLNVISAQNVTVTLATSGTATTTDYTLATTTVLILAGNTNASVTLSAKDDLLDEMDETVIIDIASVTNGTESGTQTQTVIILDDDHRLTIVNSGSGSGTTTSTSTPAMNCTYAGSGAGTGTCSGDFAAGTQVVLTASAASGSIFGGFTATGCSGTGPCTVTMDGVKVVTAKFDQAVSFDFNVTATTTIYVTQGLSATTTVTVSLVSGTAGPVSLSTPVGCPTNATCSFSPNPVTPTATSTLTIATASTTPTGTSTLTVTGTAGGTSKSATINVIVVDAALVMEISGHGGCRVAGTGDVYCWGRNEQGQLGNSAATETCKSLSNGCSRTPIKVIGLSNVASIGGGHYHTCAVLLDTTVKCWGDNEFGQLGKGSFDTTRNFTPVQVKKDSAGALFNQVRMVEGGEGHNCALRTDGTVWCWGRNVVGELGNGVTTSPSLYPTQVKKVDGSFLTGATALSGGLEHACALVDPGDVYCWGRNNVGQLGRGNTTTTDNNKAVKVTLGGTAIAVAGGGGYTTTPAEYGHTCALLSDKVTIKCWGNNSSGQVGDGTTTQRTSPVNVSLTLSGVTVTSLGTGGMHTCISLSDKTSKCWGANGEGGLGIGNTTAKSTPTTVVGTGGTGTTLTGVFRVWGGGHTHTCWLLENNDVYCAGHNDHADIGLGVAMGDPNQSTKPVKVLQLP